MVHFCVHMSIMYLIEETNPKHLNHFALILSKMAKNNVNDGEIFLVLNQNKVLRSINFLESDPSIQINPSYNPQEIVF